MGQWTFSQCAGLTSVTIGNNVTSIEVGAFSGCSSLTSVTIPNSVGGIGDYAFADCVHLASVTLGTNVTAIGSDAFYQCTRLTTVTVPDRVISIRSGAFRDCASLTSVQLGTSVLYVQGMAFFNCPLLTGAYFKGVAPQAGTDMFSPDSPATVYYLSGTTGWGPTWGGRPTALWNAQVRTSDASFGVRTNQFGFDIAWASGRSVVVEASENLANPVWLPVRTNTLTGDSVYFSDLDWTNHSARFYRIRSP